MLKLRNEKRVGLPRPFEYTNNFKKDWNRLCRSGRYDMRRLREAMMLLIINEEPLGLEWKDHALKGDWKRFRECHIGGDFLLVYELTHDGQFLVFTRAGTHAELFE